MGCPLARNQDLNAMPHTRASTSSKNMPERGCNILHIATLGVTLGVKPIGEEERGSVSESFTLRHKENSAGGKEFSNAQYSRSRKQSRASLPSYQRLAPGSPSESNSSSKISNLGSSSSSSPSSTSSYNETASFAAGELSPLTITGKEGREAWCSPTRERYQGCSTPSKTWDDAEMQFKSSLFEANDILGPPAEVLDIVAMEQTAGMRSGESNCKYLEFDRELVDARIIHCDEGKIPLVVVRPVAKVCVERVVDSLSANNHIALRRPQKDGFEGKLGSESLIRLANFPDAAPSKEKCKNYRTDSADSSNSAIARRKYIQSGSKESGFKHRRDYCKEVGLEMYEARLSDEVYAGSKMRRGGLSAFDMKSMNQVQGSTRRKSDAQAPSCSSAPYDTDISVDALSLQLRATSYSPLKLEKPPRSSSSSQPSHETEKDPYSHFPISPQLQLNAKYSAGSASAEIFLEKGTSTTPTGRKKKESSDVSSDKLGASMPSTISQGMHKNAKSPLAPVTSKSRVHEDILRQSLALVSDGKYTEKADAFTPHAPLLPKNMYKEEPKPNPSLQFTSKSQWDWRSKSIGAKASIKSAVRNLEATLSGSRSLSLPKTRSRVQKEPKIESSRLLDRVFISPIRVRSSKQIGILTPIERPKQKSGEIKKDVSPQRRDSKVITSNPSSHYGVPSGTIIRPLLPIGYNHVEVACKPFFPASKNVRWLPAPRGGALGVERPDSFSQKSSGSPSDALSPSMLHAQLHCTLRDGLPCYTMTLEGSEEMMIAKVSWVESHSSREGCQWQYSFHSGQGRSRGLGLTGWRSWVKKETKTGSDLSGVMKVSTVDQWEAMLATKGQQPLKVLEFVLYDGKGTEVSHSQSLRYCSADKPYLSSRDSPSSLSHPCSESSLPLSPTDLDMTINNRQHAHIHKGTGGHRPSLSLDAWSDSEVPDSAQSSTPSSSAQVVELAALVIQQSAEGDSHAYDRDYIGQSSKGWGLKFLNGMLESEVSHTISRRTEGNEVDPSWVGPNYFSGDPKVDSLDLYARRKQEQRTEKEERGGHLSLSSLARQESFGSVTLLLPTGEHNFPSTGSKGPSSLIERWRAGGSCECGGWDLGCGISVISSECGKGRSIPYRQMNTSALNDPQFTLFSQGSKPELMLSLSPSKQGEFKLRFQGQLPPLRVFATAVAVLHSHQSPFFAQVLASPTFGKPATPWPASSSKAPSMASLSQSSSFMSPSPGDSCIMIPNFKERPPLPPQKYSAAPRRSDAALKDKMSPLLVHNATYSNYTNIL